MKEAELRKYANCGLCGKKILHTQIPLFYRVTIERFGVDLKACQRQDALATMLNSTALAMAMGPDPDVAKPVMNPLEIAVCEKCALDDVMIGAIPELAESTAKIMQDAKKL